ncbi:MAG: 5-methyltetrahydropteroyltriglutamate--homocysteine S-methyltransferase [Bacteroidetes bacterium QS_8_64_10]|nr:MAG: 5-methyltetrahydropteroyltriglutamate--homocysteine S-methyltransferase [Bacteroidetes bacterium QS_8_64_10]
MILSTNLGYPRIGANRELKRAVEAYWDGDLAEDELRERCRALRKEHWQLQADLGLGHVPSNDFSLYDQVLDAVAMVGAVPDRFDWSGGDVDLDTYFAMARGVQEKDMTAGNREASGTQAMEMTKWFDTNYHYIVPEFEPEQSFELASTKVIDEFNEAQSYGLTTRPVLIGPVSLLLLGKMTDAHADPLDLLEELLPVYEEVLRRLEASGAEWVQLDEPCLALDLSDQQQAAYDQAYERLGSHADLDLLVATYFGGLAGNRETALNLPVSAVHLDLVRAPEQLGPALETAPDDLTLSLGLIDGRNVWRADLDAQLDATRRAVEHVGADRVMVGPSCSLLHVPVDLETEPDLGDEARTWLAFARQKIEEIVALARVASGEDDADTNAVFTASRQALESRRGSDRIHDETVQERMASVEETMLRRSEAHSTRRVAQQERLNLPALPTTTIGSFPQTADVREARRELKSGDLDRTDYERFIEERIADTIRRQEAIGLDVLVHGEPERSDMVEYFGQQLEGFLFTENGWVQSYGSRCVRPPIIYGDVARPEPMTVRWTRHAQSQTEKPVKGMLTGPVTILQWSFARDDQPRATTCRQIALAIRDEVADLERAGTPIIQIDEPALREGLPLRRAEWADYLSWAVGSFRLASAGARSETQIHTHMCYSEFGEILGAIADMDADVISMEASRSKMDLLDDFEAFDYPNQIGPGVYDIHSPRVPSQPEIESLIEKALGALRADQLWVNPDCGLKTRQWKEVTPALENMVGAAQNMREELSEPA